MPPHAPTGPRRRRSCSPRSLIVAACGAGGRRARPARASRGGAGVGPLRLLARRLEPVRRAIRCRARAPTTSPTTTRASGTRREEPLYPHSVEWRTLGPDRPRRRACSSPASSSPPCAAVRRSTADRARWHSPRGARLAAAWLAHATIDWLWELPALGAPAMAASGSSPPAPRRAAPRRRGRSRPGDRWSRGRVAAASYALPGARGAGDRAGVAAGTRIPAAARERFERARTAEPAERPRRRHRRHARAPATATSRRRERAFRRALAPRPGDWYAQTQLAVVDLGRRGARRRSPGLPAPGG